MIFERMNIFRYSMKWCKSLFLISVHYNISKAANFCSNLVPLLHFVFCRKFNYAKLLFESFFTIINIFCNVQPKSELFHFKALSYFKDANL